MENEREKPLVLDTDLHCHCAPYSTCAKQSVDELIARAKAAGVKTLAITNHDTVKGIPIFREKCEANGIRLISGVEIGCRVYQEIPGIPSYVKIHILGLDIHNLDSFEGALHNLDGQNKAIKLRRNRYLIEKYHLAIGENATKVNLELALVSSGAFSSLPEAKVYMKSQEIISQFQLDSLSPSQAIRLIHSHGGKAILAHPYQGENHYAFTDEQVDAILASLNGFGFDGIEVFHPYIFTRGKVSYLLAQAVRYHKAVTIGSDRHFKEDRIPGSYFGFENELRNSDYKAFKLSFILDPCPL